MTKTNDLEEELKNLKLIHLTESELISYCEHQQDKLTRARIDSHLKQCFICERRLDLIREASPQSNHQQITAEDIGIVRRATKRATKEENLRLGSIATRSANDTSGLSFSERLIENLRELSTGLRIQFGHTAIPDAVEPAVWRWQSLDRALESLAILERTGDLTIRVWSCEPEMEGVRLTAQLGRVRHEFTMRRISASAIGANLHLHVSQSSTGLSDIVIEVI